MNIDLSGIITFFLLFIGFGTVILIFAVVKKQKRDQQKNKEKE